MNITIEQINSKDIEYIEIIKAVYLGTTKSIDFKSFLFNTLHPSIKKYSEESLFKSFNIVDGNLNWNDYDLIFPLADLYEGHV